MKPKNIKDKDIDKNIVEVIEQITQLSDKQTRHIQSLTRIGVALSSVTNLEKLFDLILDEAIVFSNADAATIYTVSEDKQSLNFVLIYNKTLNLKMGGSNTPVTWPAIALYDEKGKPKLKHIVTNVFHKKRLLCFEDVYSTPDYDISGTKSIDASHGYQSKSMLTLPLKNHEDEVLGILQVINSIDKHGKIAPFKDEHIVMLKSLASQAAIAMSNRKLINDLETLLMQFMHSIAKGIERKSKYSSNHILRVAVLADMLAKVVNGSNNENYREKIFNTEELKELSMAGLMHDVGKIATPEHIMDKSTKLEAFTDRIEIVNLRFELFKKALALYKHELGLEPVLELGRKWYLHQEIKNFADLMQLIDTDMDFIGQKNRGVEYLTDEALHEIKRISRMEFDFEGKRWNLLSENEFLNLQIRKGTLSAEEKKTMDQHVMITWEMLSELSFPAKYKNVAKYAASHHEKLNGKGHPFKLQGKDLPLQSRILAIADIYEALTAVDRPYKKGKKLSEALAILATCAKEVEIDANLLDLMLDSGLYLEFAKKYMQPEQIDVPDIQEIKKIYHPELNHHNN